jgi:hypothetical protein
MNMRLQTDFWPVSDHSFAWSASDADSIGEPIGHGSTKDEAVADLMAKLQEGAAYEAQRRYFDAYLSEELT